RRSGRDRHKRTVGSIESAMPADGIPAAHSSRTETSARPVPKGRSKEDYTIPRPSKRGLILAGARHEQKPVTPMSIASFGICADYFRSSPASGQSQGSAPGINGALAAIRSQRRAEWTRFVYRHGNNVIFWVTGTQRCT